MKKNEKMLVDFVIKSNQRLKKRVKELEEIILKMNNFKAVLSVSEACEEFGISKKTFYRYKREGLKCDQPKMNGKIFVKRINIENFLRACLKIK